MSNLTGVFVGLYLFAVVGIPPALIASGLIEPAPLWWGWWCFVMGECEHGATMNDTLAGLPRWARMAVTFVVAALVGLVPALADGAVLSPLFFWGVACNAAGYLFAKRRPVLWP